MTQSLMVANFEVLGVLPFDITVVGVEKLLLNLDPSKAPSPDGNVPRVFKDRTSRCQMYCTYSVGQPNFCPVFLAGSCPWHGYRLGLPVVFFTTGKKRPNFI